MERLQSSSSFSVPTFFTYGFQILPGSQAGAPLGLSTCTCSPVKMWTLFARAPPEPNVYVAPVGCLQGRLAGRLAGGDVDLVSLEVAQGEVSAFFLFIGLEDTSYAR